MIDIFHNIKVWFCELGLFKTIEIFAGLGAFLASLVALFTLREIRSQRKDSIRPNLFLKPSSLAYCFPNSDELILRTKWLNNDKIENDEIVYYNIINAGSGVAEDLILTEEFDLKKAFGFIKKYDKDEEIIFTKTEFGFNLTTRFDDTFTTLFRSKPQNKRELGYMLTHSQDKKGAGYAYDSDYLLFISCFDYLRNKYDRFLSFTNFPPNYITLRYKDSSGNRYKREFISTFMSVSDHSYIVTIEDKKNKKH